MNSSSDGISKEMDAIIGDWKRELEKHPGDLETKKMSNDESKNR